MLAILGTIAALGYTASALTLATFAQRSMLPMRVMAIGANICFISYGAMGRFIPVLTLHLVLLQINAARLRMLIKQSRVDADRPPKVVSGKSAAAGASSGLL